MNIKTIIFATLLLAVCCVARAHDFVVTLNGQKVYFNIKSKNKKTVEVTYKGSIADGKPADYVGELAIPAKVKHDNTVFSVVAVGAKAFSGADRLTGITLPMGVAKIGDFAFEGCTSLGKIVFPGNGVEFGEGVFFKCDKIKGVSFGSDWKEADLKMFRWSDSLSTVTIPAKMEKIRNMKSLKNLETIVVDINNAKFTAIDGILYNKSCETLYGCPRAYKGAVKVAEGTKNITQGAFIDCKGITKADFPASLTTLSFREFSRMEQLQEIIFRGEEPIMTAKGKSGEQFLLHVTNKKVVIIVPKSAKKKYKAALVQTTGEYTELNGTTPYLVESDRMPGVKNIKGVNKFQ